MAIYWKRPSLGRLLGAQAGKLGVAAREAIRARQTSYKIL
jgi:hypothetical protein